MSKVTSSIFQQSLYELAANAKRRVTLFRDIPVNQQGFILLSLSKNLRLDLLNRLKTKEIVAFMHYLDPDEVTDLLQNLGKHRRKKIISALSRNIGDKVNFLLRFSPNIAAGIMSLDYINVDQNITFEQLAKIIRKHEKRTGKVPTVLVVQDGFLLGELESHVIGLHRPKEKITKYIKRVLSVQYDREEEEIIRIFKRNPHNRIVVLDDDKSIIGVIHSDDLLQMLQRESANNLMDFAGVSDQESVHDSIMSKVKYRYKWLILNLGTAFLAASVVSYFQETIAAFVLLAVYMPIIAGMGGNAGTQTLAVLVRGIAIGEIQLQNGGKVIFREVVAGAINGLINGTIVALVATFFNFSPILGIIVGFSMVINLAVAGFFGSITPLIMKRIGKDPATSATIFITTATDLFGFFIFLWMAQLMLV